MATSTPILAPVPRPRPISLLHRELGLLAEELAARGLDHAATQLRLVRRGMLEEARRSCTDMAELLSIVALTPGPAR